MAGEGGGHARGAGGGGCGPGIVLVGSEAVGHCVTRSVPLAG
jgi:hypothetical protein